MAGALVRPGGGDVALRVCAEPSCPTLIPAGTRDGRCDAHRRAIEQARGTRQQRGYDADYDKRRAADVRALRSGTVLTCWRCAEVIYPHHYSLGHCDDDRRIIHGPEHLTCNLAHTRGGCTHISHMT